MTKKEWIWRNWFSKKKLFEDLVYCTKQKVLYNSNKRKMKQFKILIAEDAEYGEVVDSIADVFGMGITIERRLKDGFQLEDLLVLVQQEAVVREVISDFPTFLAQFKQLSGETAVNAVNEARTRTERDFGPLGVVSGFIYGILTESAETYKFIEASIVEGSERLESWKALFSKTAA